MLTPDEGLHDAPQSHLRHTPYLLGQRPRSKVRASRVETMQLACFRDPGLVKQALAAACLLLDMHPGLHAWFAACWGGCGSCHAFGTPSS